ncbi:MAG: PilT/PilU family type 4a pilus ATPase [Desulfuromonadaceae bacterium]|nr:PilT/PilU family type 4a pilus ATPase [Desulfuromonadaceae bacterium]
MTAFDQYVEKVVLHNRVAAPELLERAKAYLQSHPELELAELLVRAGALKPPQVEQIRQRFMALQDRPAAAAVAGESATAPSPVPQSPAVAPVPETAVAAAPSPFDVRSPATARSLTQLLGWAREQGASDLHVNAGSPPLMRKDGQLICLDQPPVTAAEAEELLFSILKGPQREQLRHHKALDVCCEVPGQGRYRSCFAQQSRGWDGAFRIINNRISTFEELQLPPSLKGLTEYHQGLILVTGPGGCGKTTTLAAMVELINRQRDDHIITMEDPIEYVFTPAKSHISQREVGSHTRSFSAALRAALREDPDVIMIGELRDRETASLAISAAETGHLVLASLHTTGAGQTISRILDFFPPDQQGQVRAMISESIRGIVCQRLLPKADGQGRALALEIMLNNTAIGNLIRDDRMFQLPTMMQINRDKGMCQLEDSLLKLVNDGLIPGEEAWFAAINKKPFEAWRPKVPDAAADSGN